MFERFTDRARRVLVLAQGEARLLGHDFVGTEHLLLGRIRQVHEAAAGVLQDLGVDLTSARQQVIQQLPANATRNPGPATRAGHRRPSIL